MPPITVDLDSSQCDVSVIVATKGRRDDVAMLLLRLQNQERVPDRVLVIGTCLADIDVSATPTSVRCHSWVAERRGTCSQRNEGIDYIRRLDIPSPRSIVVFLDDDFRPADDWLLRCCELFREQGDVVGLTGCILADGVQERSLDESEANAYLGGASPPCTHWASGSQREIDSVYGCNMAFRGTIFDSCRFDEELPLYGWQEDRDITGQARKFGRVLFVPDCRGVHLGSAGGRTNGLKFGYSQIANLIYLHGKGTVQASIVTRFVVRAVLSNVFHTLWGRRKKMYGERLKGNQLAFADLIRGSCRPRRITELP